VSPLAKLRYTSDRGHASVLRIFISSTAVDLREYRDKVRDAVLRLENLPIAMETFSAQGQMSQGKYPLTTSKISGAGTVLFRKTRGLFRMLGCYMDDSADHGRKTVFSVGGFVGESERWFDVERHWSRALAHAGVDYFRTYECVNLDGEFQKKLVDVHGLTTARVIADALLNDLKQIIATSEIYALCTAILMEDYRQVLSEADGGIVLNPDPYVYAHYQFIGTVLDQLMKFERFEVCAFLYDESSKAALMQAGWEGYKKENPNWAKHAGTFEPLDDKVHIPIQVADLLAYTTTKVYASASVEEAKNRGEQQLKSWLKDHLIRSTYCDATYLRALVAANIDRVKAEKAKNPNVIVL
jgi:hypothetical protein